MPGIRPDFLSSFSQLWRIVVSYRVFFYHTYALAQIMARVVVDERSGL